MPSIQSKLFNTFVGRSIKAMLGDGKFDVYRTRERMAAMEKRYSPPKDVGIEPQALSHCEAEWIRPGTRTDRVVLYFPGGAWTLRSPAMHRLIVARLAKAANANAFLVFYRLAPEHPFPAAIEDCVEGYRTLLDKGIDPSRIVIGGDSAGGNLTLGSLLALRDRGLPLPTGAFALSPCTDMDFRDLAKAWKESGSVDPMLPDPCEDPADDGRLLYWGGDATLQDHPYVSPARGDLRGLCPLLLQVGSREWLRDQAIMYVDRARAAGVDAEVEVWDGQPHVFQGMPFPESELAFEHLSDFIRRRCP